MRVKFISLFFVFFQIPGLSQMIPAKEKGSLNSVLEGKMGCGIVHTKKEYKDTVSTKIYLRCGVPRSVRTDEPLFIIDGVIHERLNHSKIIAEDIDSIWILKGSVALTFYGSNGENGVVVITTKKSSGNSIVVKDFLNGNPVAGATVSFISVDKKDTLMVSTNDSGKARMDKLTENKDYIITISSIGYKTVSQAYNTRDSEKKQQFFLTRDEKLCEPVLIKTFFDLRGTRCLATCSGVKIEAANNIVAEFPGKLNSIKNTLTVYPNPVVKGGNLNIQINPGNKKCKLIRILNINGSLLYSRALPIKSDTNSFRVVSRAQWPAGTYILQILYENGSIAASEKIIIQ